MKLTQKLLIMMGLLLCFNLKTKAQAGDAPLDVKYRRNSLHLMLLESDNFPGGRKETVMNAYNNAPFPDKYNDHDIGFNSFDPKNYTVTDEERKSAGVKKSFFNKMGAAALSEMTSTTIENDGADMPIVIDKYLKDKKIANKLIAKWFDQQPTGAFDTKLIGERGSYNASEMDANIAKGSARGTAALQDAGEELIANTFIVFTKLQFVSNEPIAAAIRTAGQLKAARLPIFLQDAAKKVLDVAYNKAKEGYSVWTTSYLYKLKWTDTTAAIFYDQYWMDSKTANLKKKAAFDNSSEFEMEFIGSEKSSTLVTFSLKSKRTEDQTVELATVRNIDAVFAKLQKKYEEFKPKTPLFTGDPITAKIGMKEGIDGGEKFEVLEQTVDPKTGLTKYVRKGIITVDKNAVWDNRFNAGEDTAEADDKKKGSGKTPIDRTTFKGGSKYFAGMLIRQIK